MINRNKFLLQINFDQEAENEEEIQIDSKKLNNNNKAFDSKFQSNAMMKGMFFNGANQDQQYEVVTIPQPKKESYQKTQNKSSQRRNIKLINEIQYQSDQKQNQGNFQPQKEEKKQQNVFIERQAQQPEPQRLISNNFRQNLLDIVLSDDEEGSKVTSEGSNKEEEEEQQENYQQRKVQMKKDSKYAPKGRLNYEQLLEGVEDMNAFSRKFSRQLIQPKQILSLLIIRQNSGLNAIWPKYQFMFWDTTKQILYCKKMMGSSTSNYYITTEEGIENVEHLNFISKMRSNFSGSSYQIFDNGVNPQKAGNGGKVREIHASIRFKSQIISLTPRTFEVFVLKPGVKYSDFQQHSSKQEVGLEVLYDKQQNRDKIFYFKNRLPVFSEAVKGYILNFGGRVHVPSAKNFILEDNQTNQQVLMMGKKSDELFRVDISWPLSPYIAACICLANFDSKFISE